MIGRSYKNIKKDLKFYSFDVANNRGKPFIEVRRFGSCLAVSFCCGGGCWESDTLTSTAVLPKKVDYKSKKQQFSPEEISAMVCSVAVREEAVSRIWMGLAIPGPRTPHFGSGSGSGLGLGLGRGLGLDGWYTHTPHFASGSIENERDRGTEPWTKGK